MISWSETTMDVTLSLKSFNTWIGKYAFRALLFSSNNNKHSKTAVVCYYIGTTRVPKIPRADGLIVRAAEQHSRIGIVAHAVDALYAENKIKRYISTLASTTTPANS